MHDQTSLNEGPQLRLQRELGWLGAAIMGLASVIGAGIFVSIGIVAGISGSATIGALVVAGLLAACNSLNIAQLAVSHPVSGGIYEYGYKYLNPWLGFTGGWIYLLGKTAVAATAALGFSGYLLNNLGFTGKNTLVLAAETAVILITLIVSLGIRSSKIVTTVVVATTLISLISLVIAGLFYYNSHGFQNLNISIPNSHNWIANFAQSVALMFVSYNGAARISMVGEEILDPRRSIPRAITFTIVATMVIYISVAVVSLGTIGPEAFAEATRLSAAPLKAVADALGSPIVANLLTVGAITSMLSILLTTVLGLSRLLLAMGRRQDMPLFLTRLNQAGTNPYLAVLTVGILIALLVSVGNVKVTWFFSTLGALYRSAITSIAALKIDEAERLYPRFIGWLSLFSSIALAFCIEWHYWLIGLGLIGLGLIWRLAFRQLNSDKITLLSLDANQTSTAPIEEVNQ